MPCSSQANYLTRPPALRRSNFAGRQAASGFVPAGTWAEPFRLMRCIGHCTNAPSTLESSVLRRPNMRQVLLTAKTTLNPAYGQFKICLPKELRLDAPISFFQGKCSEADRGKCPNTCPPKLTSMTSPTSDSVFHALDTGPRTRPPSSTHGSGRSLIGLRSSAPRPSAHGALTADRASRPLPDRVPA